MHTTTVITKDGRTHRGILTGVCFASSPFTFSIVSAEQRVILNVVDCLSVVTEADRRSDGSIGDVDEIERFRKLRHDARHYGWCESTLPVEDWENATEG